jgi:two-component system response regulator FixJ
MAAERVVHIVDDDAAVRRSLERLLRAANFVPISYATAAAVIDAAPGLSAGCLLLDIWMPGLGGFEAQARLAQLGVRLPVIVMTGYGDVPTAVKAMKSGAVDFIEKPFDEDRLLGAVEAALRDGGPSPRDREASRAAERMAALSPREREVLDGLVAGRPNKAIAFELGISVRTVEVHRARMLERLGTGSLAEAIRLAVLATMAPRLRR